MLLHLADQKEAALEGRKDKSNKKTKQEAPGRQSRSDNPTPTEGLASNAGRHAKTNKACKGHILYGCGLLQAGHFFLLVAWPLVVLFVILLEIVETMNAVLLETPIQLLRLISGDSIVALQVRSRSRFSNE